jgi:hypothetical protein
VHPASRLAAFIVFAVFVPLLPLAPLVLLSAALLLVLAACGLLHDYAKLVWRVKFVLLALGVAYLLGGVFDTASLLSWLRSILYLLALLAALLLLVLSQQRPQLLCGLVTLLRPLAALGIPTHAFCVRMILTLDYALALRGQPWRQLLQQVMRTGGTTEPDEAAQGDDAAQGGNEIIAVPRLPWRWHDALALAGLAAALIGGKYLLAL